jgi:hypothetical protein
MQRYIVISRHEAPDCAAVLNNFLAAGYITHFDWGCGAGEHCGWAVIEADMDSEALLVVPAGLRKKAQVVRLTRYTREDLEKHTT